MKHNIFSGLWHGNLVMRLNQACLVWLYVDSACLAVMLFRMDFATLKNTKDPLGSSSCMWCFWDAFGYPCFLLINCGKGFHYSHFPYVLFVVK